MNDIKALKFRISQTPHLRHDCSQYKGRTCDISYLKEVGVKGANKLADAGDAS